MSKWAHWPTSRPVALSSSQVEAGNWLWTPEAKLHLTPQKQLLRGKDLKLLPGHFGHGVLLRKQQVYFTILIVWPKLRPASYTIRGTVKCIENAVPAPTTDLTLGSLDRRGNVRRSYGFRSCRPKVDYSVLYVIGYKLQLY